MGLLIQIIKIYVRRNAGYVILSLILVPGINIKLAAQYFGRNKPTYKVIDYNVLQTPHFEIYNYLENDSVITIISEWAEKWYKVHQKTFIDTFKIKNPIILYNTHADFQQTNTINSLIGPGTGGVTEGLKNRVIMPVALSLAQTDHTLGHELVHAFQYHMLLKTDPAQNSSARNLPLWMVEGMAEYLSIGSVDPHTSMWMRDAIVNNDFPTLKKLSTDSRYFPYRYGEAFWAMVGKTWGDTVILPLFKRTAQYGFNKAVKSIFGFNQKTLSGLWKSSMQLHFNKYIKDHNDSLKGKQVISDKNGGRMNISPSISPDGKYIAFFSEKNIFTLDLFLADASKGKIIKKLSSVVKNNEIDDFNFIESSGTWSPDGKKFAFVIVTKGINKLAILDVKKGRIIKEIEIKGVPSFYNPAWSPDGKTIVFSGLVNGVGDLYQFYLDSGKVEKLTSDFTSDIHPSWSSDGRFIVFSKECIIKAENEKKFSFNLALLDLKHGKVTKIDAFPNAYNMNPCFSADDKSIFFLSDADGFRNLYKYDIESQKVFRLTDYVTGISGLTPYSPAITVAREKDLIAYTYYYNNEYKIWAAMESDFSQSLVDKDHIDLDAGILPPVNHVAANEVDTFIYNRDYLPEIPLDSLKEVPFHSNFRLDYISNTADIGVSTGMFNNNMGGSINMIFSDMVGNNQLLTSLSLNGEIYDFGGQLAYINQKRKIKWGASLSHIPYRFGNTYIGADTLDTGGNEVPVTNLIIDYIRMFEDNISGFASYPLSQTRRFEAGISSSWYYFRIDRYNNYYSLDGTTSLGTKREKLPAPTGNNFQQISLSYVEDNSHFGMTAPMEGRRARYQAGKYFGAVNFYTALIDYRNYFFIKPFGLAFRLYHYGRYGNGADNNITSPIYLGYPWLIRGYENISFYGDASPGSNSFNISRLSGTKIIVANAELRFPLSGPKRLALIKSGWLFTDLNLFFDSGLAWNSGNNIKLDWQTTSLSDTTRIPVYSTGVSLRINLLGYLVIEPYYAFPFQNGGFHNGVFGLNFLPGW